VRPSPRALIGHGLALLAAIVGTLAVTFGLIYFQFIYPTVRAGPVQPIPFSHRIHVDIKEIDCRFCHNTVERGRHAGLPPVEKCLFCHEHVIPNHPWIEELQRHQDEGEEIHWRKVTYLPDHAFFSHQEHIAAGMQCAECHGPVEKMDRIWEFETLQMGFCVNCHMDQDRSTSILDCANCHQ
jgi:hypothetical protein